MISFVWSSKYPFIAGSGGSESYTAGQIRELIRRGIPARIVTIGFGDQDGREDFPDIPFLSLKSKDELVDLDDRIVYITYPLQAKTKHQPYAILHCPPPSYQHGDPLYDRNAFKKVRLITASKFSAGMWRRNLKTNFMGHMPTVYPFAHEAFSSVDRPERKKDDPVRVLFAGRLHPDKGVYTLLAALHMEHLKDLNYSITVTTAGSNTDEGSTIMKLMEAHPSIEIVPARKSPEKMAELIAEHDIVVMPSSNIFWQELFGMLSIESQHAGTRVVASRSGGLPETNLGGLVLVEPDNPKSFAIGLASAIQRGPLTAAERSRAAKQFTVEQSVDSLLKWIDYRGYLRDSLTAEEPRRSRLPHGVEALPQLIRDRLPQAGVSLSGRSIDRPLSRVLRSAPAPAARPAGK